MSTNSAKAYAVNGSLTSVLSRRTVWTGVLYVATVAMLLRFYALPLKPLHHDEGVNALFLTSLVRPPHTYEYDPANYHGPTLYYLGWASTSIFGLTTFAIRFGTAACGLLTVLLMIALRRSIGTVGAFAAAALLAVSPGAVYFSRYFIHETLLVCFTLATVVATLIWLRGGRTVFLYLAAASAGLMFATKETAIISAGVLIIAALGSSWIFELRRASRDEAQPRPIWRPSSMLAAMGQVAAAARPRRRRDFLQAALAAGIFLLVNALFYTSLFTHWQGAIDAFTSFTFWTHTGTTAHTRPWYTYLTWLRQEEALLMLLGTAGMVLAFSKAENRFALFAALWAIGTFAAYSLIPYKTPWLALNMLPPLAISAGYALELVWQTGRTLLAPMTLAVAAVALAGYQAIVLNFQRYDDNSYPYVYVHTDREVLRLVDEVHRLAARNASMRIAVTAKDYFPLSWYFREYRAGFYGRPVATDASVVIGSADQRRILDALLGDRYERRGEFRLRPGVRLVLYVRRDLQTDASRDSDRR
jgi:uncharacterized protein (TIGR03663 family)